MIEQLTKLRKIIIKSIKSLYFMRSAKMSWVLLPIILIKNMRAVSNKILAFIMVVELCLLAKKKIHSLEILIFKN